MYQIEENAKLEMKNVISYRGKVTQQQLAQIANKIDEMIRSNKAEKSGPNVSATFAVEMSNGKPLLDVEVLVPINKVITVVDGYVFKPIFCLKNAVKIRHTGNPSGLQKTANELMTYISQKKLTPITVGYNVTVQEAASQLDVDNMIVDIYVGVSDNIL